MAETTPAAPDPADEHPSSGPAEDLVVSYCFPPYVDTSAIVAAKRVREAGRSVDVLQNKMSSQRSTDPGLASIADHLVVRRHQLPSPTLFSSWRGITGFTQRGLQRALQWDREGAGYARLYSRAHFTASHVLAARLALLRPGMRWTAEFSDPLSRDVTGAVRHAPAQDGPLLEVLGEGISRAGFRPPTTGNSFQWAEQLAFALADTLVFTNEHQRELMLETVEDDQLVERVRGRSEVSPHPTLPPSFYTMADPDYPLDPDRRHLGYFGNFYATRGMGSVLAALEALPGRLRSQVGLHVFAGRREEVEREVERRGLGDCVRVGPFVGYLDFLALCTRMDVLLVSDAVTDGLLATNPFLPSKWSDYRGSGTSVWGMVEPGSVLDAQPLQHRSPVEHTSAAVQVLAEIARG
ncbi:hypothetical protein BJF86_05250 [Serinicoccus sp. CNJ-927]|uniref:hypothetical protein n=1 Tax=Serinicoccus sp. CNJ-927 TaxID=1904970 RepID=UPI000969808B|nr:hypothetical protein [Serinicoccus sp. CNJ-927]OLT40208.1 hypothetical protein BJF86_05250 [Serinicoccus sp. CNJ-927]